MIRSSFLSYIILLLITPLVWAQQPASSKYTISGTVKGKWGERLEGAFVVFMPGNKGAIADKKGNFSVMLEGGTYEVTCQFIGMAPYKETVVLNENKTLDISLTPVNFSLKQVEITTQSVTDVNSVQMGSSYMDEKLLSRMPKLLGEADVLRAVSALPGVVNAGEGTSGFFVRGGSADQNLVLMDGAPLFNANHLFGFFSVYNPDILKSFVLHRSSISARYGGRISSVLDVSLRDGNTEKMKYEIGVSPITAKFSMDGPLSKKAVILVAARGAYPDYILNIFPGRNIKNSSGYFYDGNLKLKYKFNEKNSVDFSGYHSADGFKFPNDTTYHWTNTLSTLSWRHLFNNNFTGTATLVKSIYKNTVEGIAPSEEFELNSAIDLTQARLDFGYFGKEKHQIDFGAEATHYKIKPGDLKPYGTSSLNSRTLEDDKGYELIAYVNDEIELSKKLSVSLGLRYSYFAKIGASSIFKYAPDQPRSEQTITDTLEYRAGSVIQSYQGFEPRVAVKYSISDHTALKAGFSRTRQYIQLISNTASITPVDVWKLSNNYIKPQIADQISIGYFHTFPEGRYEFSWEVYYKKLYNQVDYKDGAVLLLNPALEADLLFGDGNAFGSEWMLRKNMGRLTGWVSLTYSKVYRKIEGNTPQETINNGDTYPANFDKPINLNIFTDYHLWPNWKVSANFTYVTGRPITAADSWYRYQGQQFANYVGRNQQRMPDYHRLDLSLNREEIKKANFSYSWGFSVYNLYGRKNAYSVLYQHRYGSPPGTYKLAVIGIPIPSVNFNIKF